MTALLKRHLCEKVSVQQLICAQAELNSAAHPDFIALVREHLRGTVSTAACEEMIGTAKNMKVTRNQRRYRRPETSALIADRYLCVCVCACGAHRRGHLTPPRFRFAPVGYLRAPGS